MGATKTSTTPTIGLPPLLPTPPLTSRMEYQTTAQIGPITIKKLTAAQMQERHNKGLCFSYNERFLARHRCKAEFYLRIFDDEEDSLPVEKLKMGEMNEVETEIVAISLHALVG
ncbi:hypothetical protein Patl1_15364 [Pistacia atlantica]|uniref:Uncharacterized protein n=1 Tax=Pistacia atlantica TaxID=434234 RepID=A0ACC1BAZ9_9ROSI|nr:hypothetical protein Patl1_15364 [Pistacia atlantica]